MLIHLESEDEWEDLWNAECAAAITTHALQKLRSESRLKVRTIEAFTRVVLDGQPVAKVARELSMSEAAVYVAKQRCARRLQPIVTELKRRYEFY